MLPVKHPLAVLAICLSLSFYSQAQLEVFHAKSKDFKGTGFGAFLNVAIPVSEAGAVTLEGAFYYFKSDDYQNAFVPLLLGYRHTFDGSGTGFYAEPMVGYVTGGSEMPRKDVNGNVVIDWSTGDQIDRDLNGPAGAIGVGYIFPSFQLNIGLRYQRIFSQDDPPYSLYSLRLSYPLRLGRRE